MNDYQAQGKAIFEQAKAILVKPLDEWPRIAAEAKSVAEVFVKYVVPLAAIGPLARFIHGQLFGWGAFGFSFKPSLTAGLATLIIGYVLSLVGIYVLALVADFLAPKFGGVSDRPSAVRLIGYGATASFVAGIFALIPGLSILGLLGLYSFYLFYTGAGPLMKVPQDKAAVYTVVTVVAAALLYIVVGAVTAPIMHLFAGGADLASGETGGKVTLPGGGAIDLDQTRKASEQIGAATNGKKPPVDPAALQALLPGSIGSYQRSAVESTAMGAMGSEADGTYSSGGNSFHLKITDMAALGAIASLGSAFGVSENKEDADGYDKTGTVDGHMQSEAWHKSSSSGKFGVVVGGRFSIEAEGHAASIDELKAAVAGIDQSKLESLSS